MNKDIRSLLNALFVAMQYILPQHLLSRLVATLARSQFKPLKEWLVDGFISSFAVDMSEAAEPDPRAYTDFNAFFTRALKSDARPIDSGESSVVSPADGAISQLGRIESGRMMQAKNHHYTAAELLASDEHAQLFAEGAFATIYLSPRDYHRVHMPIDARLTGLRYVPGKLFSVNQVTAEGVPGLFARNERLVCLFETAHGPMAMVLVGAMIVAGIETVWTGPVTPAGKYALTLDLQMPEEQRRVRKGAEMGRFMLGSTVILLFPRETVAWESALDAGAVLRMGQCIGSLHRNP